MRLKERLEIEASIDERFARMLSQVHRAATAADGTASSMQGADTPAGEPPAINELLRQVGEQEKVLAMHRLLARERVLSAGADWRDPTLQRIVAGSDT